MGYNYIMRTRKGKEYRLEKDIPADESMLGKTWTYEDFDMMYLAGENHRFDSFDARMTYYTHKKKLVVWTPDGPHGCLILTEGNKKTIKSYPITIRVEQDWTPPEKVYQEPPKKKVGKKPKKKKRLTKKERKAMAEKYAEEGFHVTVMPNGRVKKVPVSPVTGEQK